MILITGATGNTGRELVPQLAKSGRPVRMLVRDERKVAHIPAHVERAVGDLDKPETLAPAMRGVEKVFLVTYETQQDANVIEAARRAGVKQVVKLSTLEAEEHKIQVGKWHYEREQLIRSSGLEWTFLRPGMFMSNAIEWWASSIKEQGAVYFPGGKGRVAPVDPRDVAAVAALALTQPGHCGQVYALTGPELLNIKEMVQIISQVLGRPLRYADIPPLAAKLFMLRSGMDRELVKALMEMLRSLRKNEGAILTDTVEQVTGCRAGDFETWCRAHVKFFRTTGD
ncbi:MAG: SDR family oxidoreductase [Chloroflexota bacterium]|nr:MAG: SDR family oxidoreductase [Chloroflexota bacterium]